MAKSGTPFDEPIIPHAESKIVSGPSGTFTVELPNTQERGVITIDQELKAMNAINKALTTLNAEQVQRVLAYFVGRHPK